MNVKSSLCLKYSLTWLIQLWLCPAFQPYVCVRMCMYVCVFLLAEKHKAICEVFRQNISLRLDLIDDISLLMLA